jgi:hypothetical protein
MNEPTLFAWIALVVSGLGTAVTAWIGFAAFSVSRQSHRLAAKSRKDDDERAARAERQNLAESFLTWFDMRGNTVPVGALRQRADPAVEELERIIRNRASLSGHSEIVELIGAAKQMRRDGGARRDWKSRARLSGVNERILKFHLQAWVNDPNASDGLTQGIEAMRSRP